LGRNEPPDYRPLNEEKLARLSELRLQVLGHVQWLPGQVEFHTVQAQRGSVFLLSGTGAGKTGCLQLSLFAPLPEGQVLRCASSTLDRTEA
jgi:hypothetical protein